VIEAAMGSRTRRVPRAGEGHAAADGLEAKQQRLVYHSRIEVGFSFGVGIGILRICCDADTL
jgi:hypothetical protein